MFQDGLDSNGVEGMKDNDISDPNKDAIDGSGSRDGAILDGVLHHAWRELRRVNTSVADIGKILAKIAVTYLDKDNFSD